MYTCRTPLPNTAWALLRGSISKHSSHSPHRAPLLELPVHQPHPSVLRFDTPSIDTRKRATNCLGRRRLWSPPPSKEDMGNQMFKDGDNRTQKRSCPSHNFTQRESNTYAPTQHRTPSLPLPHSVHPPVWLWPPLSIHARHTAAGIHGRDTSPLPPRPTPSQEKDKSNAATIPSPRFPPPPPPTPHPPYQPAAPAAAAAVAVGGAGEESRGRRRARAP